MLYTDTDTQWMNLREASQWASQHTNKTVTVANISYLIQYGRINKKGGNGSTLVHRQDLIEYYHSYNSQRETAWKKQLGDDLNWSLSFDQYKEAETTKHVHRLHPYKGKFIPQLVEYFLDDHIDHFKTEIYFRPGDIVLDPFAGSGTTLVQAAELGLHAVGIDVSTFNALMSNSKLAKYNLPQVKQNLDHITHTLRKFLLDSSIPLFEDALLRALHDFNAKYFPTPSFRQRVNQGEIDENVYGIERERAFLPIYQSLINEYQIPQLNPDTSLSTSSHSFLDTWYLPSVRHEMKKVLQEIVRMKDPESEQIARIILSRTLRSCRATTHADLATLQKPISATYYCAKHGKMCKPLFSLKKWWETYTEDTLKRLAQFDRLRTPSWQICLTGDSRTLDIMTELQSKLPSLAEEAQKHKIKGVFSSPPYVGLIDYHEQHAYAYELFDLARQDENEIGPLSRGQGRIARESYIQGVSAVLNNSRRVLCNDFDIFLVSNDKYNLYPQIAEKSDLKIVNQFKRPVLNRTEKDKGAYAETIFHLRAL